MASSQTKEPTISTAMPPESPARAGPNAVAVGVQVPVYLSLVKNLLGYAGDHEDYEGIVRLVPTFAPNHTDKGLSRVGAVTLELLGKRGMFGTALHWP